MKHNTIARGAIVILAATLTIGLAGCSPSAAEPAAEEPPAAAESRFDQAIHDALPDRIKDSGKIEVVISGANPPWWITTPGQVEDFDGAGAELMNLVSEVMGVDIEIIAIADFAGAFGAIDSGRYDFGFYPYADNIGGPNARPNAVYVDIVQEIVPFLVMEGNPQKVSSLDELCGVTVAALVNGLPYRAAEKQALECQSQGSDLEVLGVKSVPDGVLAIRSGRADAFFQGGASLFHAEKESGGTLEVVGTESTNGFDGQFMGALLRDDSELVQPLLNSFENLFDSGDYAEVMNKWGLQAEILDAPGINLYSDWLAENPAS